MTNFYRIVLVYKVTNVLSLLTNVADIYAHGQIVTDVCNKLVEIKHYCDIPSTNQLYSI